MVVIYLMKEELCLRRFTPMIIQHIKIAFLQSHNQLALWFIWIFMQWIYNMDTLPFMDMHMDMNMKAFAFRII